MQNGQKRKNTEKNTKNIRKTEDGGPTYVKLCSYLQGSGNYKQSPGTFLKEFRVPKEIAVQMSSK